MADRMGPGDFFELVKAYAKQETVEPLRGAGRWVGFGVAGSFLLMLGGVSLTLAMLRVLQEETGTALTGNLSWVPYLATLVAALVVIALLVWRITKRSL
ncbi:MAG: hypothetical protein R2707_04190 [Acidimicrobiales bacterium]